MATPDVDLIEMGDAAVACGNGDVLQLDVHIVFDCSKREVSGKTEK